jgi:excisionase family DNA binding protein
MRETKAIQRRLLDIHEVSEYIGVAVPTLYAMVSQRRIPFVKVGRLTKFDLKKIDGWIENNSVMPIKQLMKEVH